MSERTNWQIAIECSVPPWYAREDVEKIAAELCERIDGYRMMIAGGQNLHHKFERCTVAAPKEDS